MQNLSLTYGSWQAVTPSDSVPISCRAILVSCTVAGNLVLKPSGGSTGVTIPVPVGIEILPLTMDQGLIMSTGLTATATLVALA